MITVELLTDATEFAALERDWQALWQQVGGSVFQSHSWVSTWLHHDPDAKRYRLHIAAARIDGRIAAILPLATHRQNGIRVLEWAAQRFSDYCDGLGTPALLQALWSEVRGRGGFDLARLGNVAPEAAMHPVLAAEAGMSRAEGETSLRLRSVWPDGDAWLGTLNKKKRSNHARGRRILEEFGKVSIEHHDRTMPTEIVARLVELKKASLARIGYSSVLFDHGPALVTAFASSMAQVGRLRACVIHCGDDIVAGSINVTHGKAIWAWLTAFDTRYQRASPGIMLMNEYTRRAFNDGFEEIDYLRGDEAFKFEFATSQVRLGCFIAAATLPGMAVLGALRVRAGLQRHWRPEAAGQIPVIGSAYVTANGTPRGTPPLAKPGERNLDHGPTV